jgi:hypothetical protein
MIVATMVAVAVHVARGAIHAVLGCRSFPLLSAGQNPNKKSPEGFPLRARSASVSANLPALNPPTAAHVL